MVVIDIELGRLTSCIELFIRRQRHAQCLTSLTKLRGQLGLLARQTLCQAVSIGLDRPMGDVDDEEQKHCGSDPSSPGGHHLELVGPVAYLHKSAWGDKDKWTERDE